MKCIKKWLTSLSVVTAVWFAFRAVGCIGAAHAEPPVAGDWHASAPAALAESTATWLLAGLLILKVLEMVLARVAPLTPTKLDDKAYAVVHGLRETAEEILAHVRPPSDPPPGVPAVVSGTIETKDGAP